MSKGETIDFLCKSCHCKLQVPAAMAGVSGPCPHCNSNITAPGKETPEAPGKEALEATSNKTSLPPKRLPEHIPAVKIRAAAQAIRRSARQHEHGIDALSGNASSELQYRELSPEINCSESDTDNAPTPNKLNFFSFFGPTVFAAVAGVVVLSVLHGAGILNLLNYQNGFKKLSVPSKTVSASTVDTSVQVTMSDSETNTQSKAALPSNPKKPTTQKSKPKDQTSVSNQKPPPTPTPTPPTPPPAALTPPTTESDPSVDTAATQPKPNRVETKVESKAPDKAANITKTPPAVSNNKPAKKPALKKVNPIMANVMARGEFPELKLSPSAPKQKPIADDKQTTDATPSKPLVGYLAQENLDVFLSAKTLDERLPFILEEERSPQTLKTSSLAKPFLPIKSIRLLETLSGSENNMVLHRYMLRFEDPTEPGQRLNMIALLIERIGKHPPLIQATAFLEHYDKALSQYAQQARPETATFHCIAEASTSDLTNELPDEIKNSLVRLSIKNHPYYPAKFNAYLSKQSPLMAQIGSGKSFPYTTSKYAVLSFSWNTSSGTPYIELVDIISSNGWGE
ncbi:MAG: hypothetical protein P8P36_01670 [Akkermansiaceae bacterium]|nr:hypothetical protein [Akkermansiaceae bacterium]